jgi:hypothetical protein
MCAQQTTTRQCVRHRAAKKDARSDNDQAERKVILDHPREPTIRDRTPKSPGHCKPSGLTTREELTPSSPLTHAEVIAVEPIVCTRRGKPLKPKAERRPPRPCVEFWPDPDPINHGSMTSKGKDAENKPRAEKAPTRKKKDRAVRAPAGASTPSCSEKGASGTRRGLPRSGTTGLRRASAGTATSAGESDPNPFCKVDHSQ